MTTATVPAPPLGRRDHLLGMLFGLWMIGGLFLDGWAHDNQKPETFFTPWHAVLYSGFAAAAAFAVERTARRHVAGRPWREAVPHGHGLTLASLAAFAVGGAGDLVWHEAFGIEVGLEALLSPTHLLLMVAGAGALSAPIRAAWRDEERAPSLREFLPVALATMLLTALVTFFLSFFSPFTNDAGLTAFRRFQGQLHEHPSNEVGELQQLLGVASILVLSVVLAVAVAFLLRRWRTPPGTFTLLFGVVVLAFVASEEFAHPLTVLCGLVAGAVADLLVRRGVAAAVVCAGAVAALWLAYFGALALDEGGLVWAAELWAGSTFLAAVLAAGVGLLVTPLPATRGGSVR